MSFCGLGSCIGLYMRVSGSSAGDNTTKLSPEGVEEALYGGGGDKEGLGLFVRSNPVNPRELMPGGGPRYNTLSAGDLEITEKIQNGVLENIKILKKTENRQESVKIIKRSDDGTKFYLKDQNGYEARLDRSEMNEDGSNQYNLIPPSDFIFELLENDGCKNIKKLSKSDSIEINGNEYGYSVEFNKAEYAVPREQNAVCSGSAVVRFDEQNGFIKPQYMLHGFNTVMTQTRGPYTRTYSGAFEKGDLSKGKITLKNLIQDETIFIIEGKFVAQEDKVPKLEGIGTVDVGPYQLSGNFEKGRLVFDGEQKVLKKNKLQDLGPIMPERCDMKNSLTFRDGDKRVVVTFNPKIGYYSYKIS